MMLDISLMIVLYIAILLKLALIWEHATFKENATVMLVAIQLIVLWFVSEILHVPLMEIVMNKDNVSVTYIIY